MMVVLKESASRVKKNGKNVCKIASPLSKWSPVVCLEMGLINCLITWSDSKNVNSDLLSRHKCKWIEREFAAQQKKNLNTQKTKLPVYPWFECNYTSALTVK